MQDNYFLWQVGFEMATFHFTAQDSSGCKLKGRNNREVIKGTLEDKAGFMEGRR